MIDRHSWPSVMISSIVGAGLGYAAARPSWPALRAWLVTTVLTYVLVLATMLGSGLLWMRRTVRDTSEPAAISIDLLQELVRLDAALTLAGLAYFLALAADGSFAGGTLPIAFSGAVCGAATVIMRKLRFGRGWPGDGEQSERVRQA